MALEMTEEVSIASQRRDKVRGAEARAYPRTRSSQTSKAFLASEKESNKDKLYVPVVGEDDAYPDEPAVVDTVYEPTKVVVSASPEVGDAYSQAPHSSAQKHLDKNKRSTVSFQFTVMSVRILILTCYSKYARRGEERHWKLITRED